MDRRYKVVLGLLCIVVGCTACGVRTDNITYSNLVDERTQLQLAQKLEDKGVEEETIAAFLSQVTDYNYLMRDMPTFKTGFITVDGSQVTYPMPYLVEAWANSERQYSDLTSRLVAYELYKDLLTYNGADQVIQDRALLLEMNILDNNPHIYMNEVERETFSALYEGMVVEDIETKDYTERIQNSWQDRGIVFPETRALEMINCFVTDANSDTIFVAEAGVVMQYEGYLVYLEKYGELYPYQATKFKTYGQLEDYLIERLSIKYDHYYEPYHVMKNNQKL